ncbi:hypothetical protein [Corynebacterium pseudodiphtheriticum]|uniref:hypothetical protein n=1 Tax=Corynebacterium pseudodiphtheriticum TaxID=37637 RepID=UPI001293716D|nr:hypothetical protein [Corynebacterium pseudodiphtheriticum]MCT1634452.1 hypothetical protein [Corynebacterium pseudodiphtheriticum]MCT1665547.1 hypothetical protein [Corynebacterium pseudodiphtheriticum]MDK8684447.1 hypothetical protein [Corynebacterium pseudodiphtheriticum]
MIAVFVLIIAAAQREAMGQESNGRAPQEFEVESGKTLGYVLGCRLMELSYAK